MADIKRVEPRTLPGFMELLPKEQILFNKLMEIIKSSYELFGFLPLDTPIIESSEVLLAKAGGETEKQIYRFNKGDNDLSLRFDLTVPLAKYVAKNHNDLAFPFKRYQIGKVYRGERAQRGRYREFYQCDVDIIGNGELSILNEAEIPSVIYYVFSQMNFGEFTIRVNNRKILLGFFESLDLSDKVSEVLRVVDKLDKIGAEKVKEEIIELGTSEEVADQIITFINIKGTTNEIIEELYKMNIITENFVTGRDELKEVTQYMRAFGIPDKNFNVDLTIARGLDYYTGTVYETLLNDYPQIGSVCSGGRYDNLAEYYTTKKLPGVGISIGLSRLFFQLNEVALIKYEDESIAKVLVLPLSKDDMEYAVGVANQLRVKGIKTELYTEDKQLKNKMNYANKNKIPFVIFVGEEERTSGILKLKNMTTGEETKNNIDNILHNVL